MVIDPEKEIRVETTRGIQLASSKSFQNSETKLTADPVMCLCWLQFHFFLLLGNKEHKGGGGLSGHMGKTQG